MSRRSLLFALAVAALLTTMFVLQWTSVRGESQTVDEGAHLAAGYSYWRTGDFRMNPEHPPLAKLVASVPLLFLGIQIPLDHPSWEGRDQWGFGRAFLYQNSLPADVILFAGRLPMMLIGLALGLLIALWARSLWGSSGALLALILYVFDPTFLAHSRYVTTDVAVALMIALTVFLFGRFLDQPANRRRLLAVLVVFALAQMTKFSAVLLWPMLVALWALKYAASDADHRSAFSLRRAMVFFPLLALVTLVVAFVMYGFSFTAPLDDPELAALYAQDIWQEHAATQLSGFPALVSSFTDPDSATGRAVQWLFEHGPVPAYHFFRGLAQVTWHNVWGHNSFLLGNFGSLGWWYYFPVAFLVKTPLATIMLLVVTFAYLVRLTVERVGQLLQTTGGRMRATALATYRSADFQYTLLIVPVVVYGVSSMMSNMNLGVRHLLPVYPFLFVLAGSLVTLRFRRLQRLWQSVLVCTLLILVVSSSLAYPHYLSYFSELVGGSANGSRYLTDSNLDWGQELKRLGVYMEEHDIPFVYIVYFGQAPLETYIPDFRYLPRSHERQAIAALDGWAAISVTALVSPTADYAWLRERPPTATIGDAIYLYDLRKD